MATSFGFDVGTDYTNYEIEPFENHEGETLVFGAVMVMDCALLYASPDVASTFFSTSNASTVRSACRRRFRHACDALGLASFSRSVVQVSYRGSATEG